jgi:alpha-tubulin suppressor-like RCC1 family protein
LALLLLGGCEEMILGPKLPTSYNAVSVGGAHSCALTEYSVIYCWGRGLNGELGDGAVKNRPVPSGVIGQRSYSVVAAGGNHTCALTESGQPF